MNSCWDAIWYILRHNFEKSYSGILLYYLVLITFWQCYNSPCSLSYSVLRQGMLTSCALTSSCLEVFPIELLIYSGNDKNMFGGKLRISAGGGSFYPSNTLDKTLWIVIILSTFSTSQRFWTSSVRGLRATLNLKHGSSEFGLSVNHYLQT